MKPDDAWLLQEQTFYFNTDGGTHRLVVRADGKVALPDHTALERRRLEDYAELGGEPCPCVAALRRWRAREVEHRDYFPEEEDLYLLRREMAYAAGPRRAWRRFRSRPRPPGLLTVGGRRLPLGQALEH